MKLYSYTYIIIKMEKIQERTMLILNEIVVRVYQKVQMCFPLLGCLVDVLPYICVVTVPVYGSFCGIDLILRVSIIWDRSLDCCSHLNFY
jgi:hypothetical protein